MEHFKLFVVLPTEEVCALRDVKSGTSIRDIRSRLEICAGLPGQVYTFSGRSGQVFQEDFALELGLNVWDGFLLRTELKECWKELLDAVRSGDIDLLIRKNQTLLHSGVRLPGVGLPGVSLPTVGLPGDRKETITLDEDTDCAVLYVACWTGSIAMCQGLLKAGFNPNSKTQHNRTPIFAAAVKDNYQVMEILLKHGALLAVKDCNGDTPLDIARQHLSTQCINTIRRARKDKLRTVSNTSTSQFSLNFSRTSGTLSLSRDIAGTGCNHRRRPFTAKERSSNKELLKARSNSNTGFSKHVAAFKEQELSRTNNVTLPSEGHSFPTYPTSNFATFQEQELSRTNNVTLPSEDHSFPTYPTFNFATFQEQELHGSKCITLPPGVSSHLTYQHLNKRVVAFKEEDKELNRVGVLSLPSDAESYLTSETTFFPRSFTPNSLESNEKQPQATSPKIKDAKASVTISNSLKERHSIRVQKSYKEILPNSDSFSAKSSMTEGEHHQNRLKSSMTEGEHHQNRLKSSMTEGEHHQNRPKSSMTEGEHHQNRLKSSMAEGDHHQNRLKSSITEGEHHQNRLKSSMTEGEHHQNRLKSSMTEGEHYQNRLKSSMTEGEHHQNRLKSSMTESEHHQNRLKSSMTEGEHHQNRLKSSMTEGEHHQNRLKSSMTEGEHHQNRLKSSMTEGEHHQNRLKSSMTEGEHHQNRLKSSMTEGEHHQNRLKSSMTEGEHHQNQLQPSESTPSRFCANAEIRYDKTFSDPEGCIPNHCDSSQDNDIIRVDNEKDDAIIIDNDKYDDVTVDNEKDDVKDDDYGIENDSNEKSVMEKDSEVKNDGENDNDDKNDGENDNDDKNDGENDNDDKNDEENDNDDKNDDKDDYSERNGDHEDGEDKGDDTKLDASVGDPDPNIEANGIPLDGEGSASRSIKEARPVTAGRTSIIKNKRYRRRRAESLKTSLRQAESLKTSLRQIQLAESQKWTGSANGRETFESWLRRKEAQDRRSSSQDDSDDSSDRSYNERNSLPFATWLKQVRERPNYKNTSANSRETKTNGLINIQNSNRDQLMQIADTQSYMHAYNRWRERHQMSVDTKLKQSVNEAKQLLEENRQKTLATAITYNEWMTISEERKHLTRIINQSQNRVPPNNERANKRAFERANERAQATMRTSRGNNNQKWIREQLRRVNTESHQGQDTLLDKQMKSVSFCDGV